MARLFFIITIFQCCLAYGQQTIVIAATSIDSYDTVITQEVIKLAGYKSEIKVMPWARCIAMIKSGDADVLGNVYLNEERKVFMHYTEEPIFNFKQFIYVKNDSNFSFDGDLNALKPYKIGTRIGFSYGEEFDEAAKAKSLQIRSLSDTYKNVRKLIANRVDMIVENPMNLVSDLEFANSLELMDQLKLAKPAINSQLSFIVTSQKSQFGKSLVDEVNSALLKLKASGKFEKIMSEDFGYTEGYK